MTQAGTHAIVPVKDLVTAKRRLSSLLSHAERQALSIAMLSDVLTALKKVDELNFVAVITRDPAVVALAQDFGVRALEETKAGVNAAVAEAARLLSAEGSDTMLTVPGDVPLATPEEFVKILESQEAGSAVTLVPDRRGTGTNALASSPPDAIQPCFGQRSLVHHQAAAKRTGLNAAVLSLPGLGLDIDLPDDLVALMGRKGETRTHEFLRRMFGDSPPSIGEGG